MWMENAQESHVLNIKQLMNSKRAPFIITTVHAPRDMLFAYFNKCLQHRVDTLVLRALRNKGRKGIAPTAHHRTKSLPSLYFDVMMNS